MPNKIRLTIMDDHQSIVDGYLYRLSNFPEIEVIATLAYGDELEPALKEQPVNVLLLDVQVPISPKNSNPYPILHIIPKLLEQYPDLAILVISMHDERSLIRAIVEAGASGYILKNDRQRIQELGKAIVSVDRSSAHNRAMSLRILKSIISKGISVMVFPEGTFNMTNKPLKEFYDGAFRLAINAQVPILPIVFPDTVQRWHYSHWWKMSPGKNRVIYLPLVPVSGMVHDDMGKLKKQVYEMMETELKKYPYNKA